MTDTTETKKMEEVMEKNKEVTSSGIDKQTAKLTDISEEDEIPDLIVDDSECSEGSIHEQLSSKKEEGQEPTCSTDKEDDTQYTEVIETVESRYSNLDQFDGKEEEGDSKSWDVDEDMSDQDRKYYEKIRNTKLTEQQEFKMAAMDVVIKLERFIKCLAFEYLDKLKNSCQRLLEVVKTLPTSDKSYADNEQLKLEGSIGDYMTAYFAVDQGDADAMRYHLHRMYHKKYEEKNDRIDEYLKNRRKVALANLQEQMDEI